MTRVSMIEGDGIGFEVTRALRRVFRPLNADIRWELFEAGLRHYQKKGVYIGEDFYESIEKTKLAIKGPMDNPNEKKGDFAITHLREEYNLKVQEFRLRGLDFFKNKYSKVDFSLFYENDQLLPKIENLKDFSANKNFQISKDGTVEVFNRARILAQIRKENTITVVLSENSDNYFDDFFLETVQEEKSKLKKLNLNILYFEEFIEEFIKEPSAFNVVICQSKYGEIISNIANSLVESPLKAKSNYGIEYVVFDIDKKDKNKEEKQITKAIQVLFTGTLLLEFLGRYDLSKKLLNALDNGLKELYENGKIKNFISIDELTNIVISHL
ncbi:MAG: isocitrate/isopropylmalate family dehydrogenase [Lagierella massiliensis]|nr:isocitrate/isopropylmalate family dehydrogenase [Lagierella massiliensis]